MSALLPPLPSTGKKKAKARRVFGLDVIDSVDNSLSYSLSEEERTDASRSTFFSAVESDDGISLLSMMGKKECQCFATVSSPSFSDANTASKPSTPDRGLSGKENVANLSPIEKPSKQKVRILGRSPLRRDLVKATQEAINKAAISVSKTLQSPISVNQSIRAARQSRKALLRQRKEQTAKEKREWTEDMAEAKKFNDSVERSRREMLNLRRNLSSKMNRKRAQQAMSAKSETRDFIEGESRFKSKVYRDQQQSLQQEREESRRASVAARDKLRENYRTGVEKLQLQGVAEERALLSERHEASLARRAYDEAQGMARRKSFAFRYGDAHRIRELRAKWDGQRLEKEHQSYELKWSGERDAKAYQRKLADERRESLMFRNREARRQREAAEVARSQALQAQQKSYELDWSGARDVRDHVRDQEHRNRQELAQKGKSIVRQRALAASLKQGALQAEHESLVQKWAGEKDAENYRANLEREKRLSLASRNRRAKTFREQDEAQKEEAIRLEHERYVHKWAGENDAIQYQIDLMRQRRDSLAFRNHKGKQQRELVARQMADKLCADHESYELAWSGDRDALAYKMFQDSERRKSLQGRNREARSQREDAEMEQVRTAVQEHDDYELKWSGERDAQNYAKQLAKERRESLQFRNKEGLRHARVMEEIRVLNQEKETESLVLKWATQSDVFAYREDLARQRRESLQQRGRQFLLNREIDEQEHQRSVMQQSIDEELHAADSKCVEAYRNQCSTRDRKSFQYRLKESRLQRLHERETLAQKETSEQANRLLEAAAMGDVNDYLNECRRRKRLSLAFRAIEARRHANWKLKQERSQKSQLARDVRDRFRDHRNVELAKQREKGQEALENIRHVGYAT